MKSLTFSLFLLLFITVSCSVESEKINYGKESCHFCKMTIVDNQHAAEAVTSKGKVFKYDAIECMINDLKHKPDQQAKKNDVEIALVLITDYSAPGVLIDAKTATFLISKGIKSPMGAFLSGFNTKEEAQKAMNQHGGSIYTWQEIQRKIN